MSFAVAQQQSAQKPLFSFPEYLAYHNGEQANAFLQEMGYKPARDSRQLAQNLAIYLNKNGDDGLRRLMYLHPDREAMISLGRPHAPAGFMNATGNGFNNCSGCGSFNNCSGCGSSFNNCAGCGGGCGGNKFSNASGSGTPGAGATERNLDRIAIFALATIVVLVALRNK